MGRRCAPGPPAANDSRAPSWRLAIKRHEPSSRDRFLFLECSTICCRYFQQGVALATYGCRPHGYIALWICSKFPFPGSGSSGRGKIWGTLAPSRHRRVWCPVEGGLHRHCKAAASWDRSLRAGCCSHIGLGHREHPVVFQCTLAAGPKCKKYGQPRPDSLWITHGFAKHCP